MTRQTHPNSDINIFLLFLVIYINNSIFHIHSFLFGQLNNSFTQFFLNSNLTKKKKRVSIVNLPQKPEAEM